ncbi:hypothetical protein ACFL26_01890 [Patescibacteria group bacterium]
MKVKVRRRALEEMQRLVREADGRFLQLSGFMSRDDDGVRIVELICNPTIFREGSSEVNMSAIMEFHDTECPKLEYGFSLQAGRTYTFVQRMAAEPITNVVVNAPPGWSSESLTATMDADGNLQVWTSTMTAAEYGPHEECEVETVD